MSILKVHRKCEDKRGFKRPTIIPSWRIWKRKVKEKGQGSTYAIAFIPHSLQPEVGRWHVTLNCIRRQDRMTSQQRSTRTHTPMKNSYLLCVATYLNFPSRYGYACEDILAFPCLSWHMAKQKRIFGQNKRFSNLYSTVGIIQSFEMLCS